ncbi:probable glycosyltransferase At5g25310 [Vigna radiata var. radiata]|uniref:Probable glycosyltransferase At5g25310 n=1 Tax=Vigna radiata var. radiata TaxID=3916 RepID=A0A1S3V131_VIGRR|nr:probable glycosyltransferase At5g25310 [Vigna radiata var. radiata]
MTSNNSFTQPTRQQLQQWQRAYEFRRAMSTTELENENHANQCTFLVQSGGNVSLPEIHLYEGKVSPKLLSPPSNNTPRRYLAFFSGGLHGPIRPNLFHYWKNHDADIRVYEYLPKDLDYYSFMLNSKFCLCPSGHEVASPRIVEAIYAECVPVILSKYYVLPFSDVLQWEAFSVQVEVSDIP